MSLRSQILLVLLLLAVLPLVLVGRLVESEVGKRYAARDTARIEQEMRQAAAALEDLDRNLATLLDTLAESLQADNRFRLAVQAPTEEGRAFLVDYAARQMSLMRLDLLLIQDRDGTVLSAGHLRGLAGSLEPRLVAALGNASGGRALLPARDPGGAFLALARTRPVTLGERKLHVVAGLRIDQDTLADWGRGGELGLALVWPGGVFATTSALAEACSGSGSSEQSVHRLERRGFMVRRQAVAFLGGEGPADAWLLVGHDPTELRAFLGVLRSRLGMVLLAAVIASALLAVLLAGRITRPLARLARQTADLDLDRLDAEFTSDRRDEVGHLTRLLGAMTARLRDGVERLKAAEHRATLGEVARQVNHDIRNGITPLRNVMRHLGEVAEREPDLLAEVFRSRRANLDESLGYLEDLATHYARLSPERRHDPCRLDAIAAEALAAAAATAGQGVTLTNAVPSNLPPISGDPVSLRRILDNLLRNALESLPPGGGLVTVDGALEMDEDFGNPVVVLSVSDSGAGIPPGELDRIFQDFFTTKPQGTGLGLSNVRRLAGDLGGSVKVASQAGRGTTFTLSFPLPEA
ncbi:MAG: ATP-binding protein [bacterium]